MACNCEAEFLRTFPGKVTYSVKLAAVPEAVPVEWTVIGFTFCICCNQVFDRVPEGEAGVLREGAG